MVEPTFQTGTQEGFTTLFFCMMDSFQNKPMSVRHEIKSQLAKLLATEDLVVEHKKCETAQFNVHTRVLTLPLWEKASNTVYDLLVGHEVGHALYTPDEDWTKQVKVPPQFVNVVEDARIEKLMKRRYAGLAKTFFAGYKELSDQDFFSLKDDDLSTYNLADRANLHFKIGNYTSVPIESGEETEIINMIADAETFADALNAAEALYKYCKQSKEQEKIDDLQNGDQPQTDNSGNSPSDFQDQEEGENDQNEPAEGGNQSSSDENGEVEPKPSNQGGEKNEPEVKTMESLEESIKDLVNNSGEDSVYLEIPKLDLSKIIVSNSEIHSECKETWDQFLKMNGDTGRDIFGRVDKKFVEFKRSAQKEVSYLVKEFECRKAADSYARASTARTGVLDCTKLHTYKYNEDIFKKVTTLADGKNHGLVFVLDWSGSMDKVMMDTVKQLFNLIWFCKKVSIPFEVYAFTSDYPISTYDENGKANLRQLAYTKKEGLLQVNEWFSMMNLLTSKVNGKTLEEQMKNIFRLADSFSGYYAQYPIPAGLNLSGTPLNESLIALHQILPKFQKENKLQKVQCVVLTDGESQQLVYHKEVKRNWESNPYIGTSHICGNSFLRDRKTGNTYSIDSAYYQFTDVLLHNLRDNFPNINFIGIRVLGSGDSGCFIRRYCGYYGNEYDKAMNSWKKEKAFSIKTSGYHTYFGLSSNALSQDTAFAVSEDATKSQIKNAFMKSLKSKKMNKRVLGEFIELVA